MDSMPNNNQQGRIEWLDSLRGLAALAVLLSHAVGVCDWDMGFIRLPVWNNFFDGKSAVTMFFVISGFVLSCSYLSSPDKSFLVAHFYVKRVTRIWIPWFVFFAASLFLKENIKGGWPQTQPSLSMWLTSMWQGKTTVSDFIQQCVFQLHDANRLLLSQDWSLGVELKASAILPLLLLLARRSWIFLLAVGLVFPFVLSTGHYYFSFIVGMLVACWWPSFSVGVSGSVLFGLGFFLYQARWFKEFAVVVPSFVSEREIWIFTTLGCGLILAGVLKGNAIKVFLCRPIFLYLGRISYSLYLVQMIVIICVAPWVVRFSNQMGVESHGWLKFINVMVICAVSLPLAALGERYVEVPCIKLGKYLAAKLNCMPLAGKLVLKCKVSRS